MLIDVISDTICPWCYIGKKHLEQALAQRPSVNARTVWRPFLLNCGMPPEGICRDDYVVRKFGREARIRRVYGAITQAGQSVDIDFDFHRIDRTPNSITSHRLVIFAIRAGKGDAAVENLYFEFFINGRDIGDERILLEIGERIGLDRNDLEAYFSNDEDIHYIYDENTRAHRMGVNGIPAFVFNKQMVISGAQEPQVLVRMLDAALATETAA